MLIWIDGEPANYEVDLSDDIVNALLELGEAGYKARHVIACNRYLARYLSRHDGLSKRAKSYFLRIYNEYTQLGAVFSRHTHVVASMTTLEPVFDGRAWRVPLHYFSREEYSEELNVVCENDTDYQVYKALASVWMSWNLPACVVSSKSRAGGGASSVFVLRSMARDPNPAYLCLIDSDREVVLGREGGTARGVRNVWDQSWRSTLHVIECRELENALPRRVVVRFLDAIGASAVVIESLSSIHSDMASYACFKSGDKPCRFHEVEMGHVGRARTVIALDETGRAHAGFAQCGQECGEVECDIFPRLGDKFLERFAAWIESNHWGRIFSRSDDWHPDALAAAELFATRSMALPRRP